MAKEKQNQLSRDERHKKAYDSAAKVKAEMKAKRIAHLEKQKASIDEKIQKLKG